MATKEKRVSQIGVGRLLHKYPWLQKMVSAFNALLISVSGMKIVPAGSLTIKGESWVKRLLYFQRLLSQIEDIEGDIAECGVLNGDGLVLFSLITRNSNRLRNIWGFDSFEGLPEPTEKDFGSSESEAKKGRGAYANIKIVEDNLKASGLSKQDVKEKVRLIKGFFNDTLPNIDVSSLAFLHIDVDLYESYKVALQYLFPRVVPGGIIAFDEYDKEERWPGAKKAIDEFLATIPDQYEMFRDDKMGKYYIIKRLRAIVT